MLESARLAYADELARVGNPSTLHKSGRLARSVVEDARERMAAALGAHHVVLPHADSSRIARAVAASLSD